MVKLLVMGQVDQYLYQLMVVLLRLEQPQMMVQVTIQVMYAFLN